MSNHPAQNEDRNSTTALYAEPGAVQRDKGSLNLDHNPQITTSCAPMEHGSSARGRAPMGNQGRAASHPSFDHRLPEEKRPSYTFEQSQHSRAMKATPEPWATSQQTTRTGRERKQTPDVNTTSAVRSKIFIAVMGATGSGKTSFVNLVTGSNLPVSNSLASCTQLAAFGSKLEFQGCEINLIDTPGFDDTERGEVEILRTIAKFLQAQYQKRITLHGVIFLHRISDLRMSGASRRSLQLFRAICGDDALRNVMIVTTMWDKVDLQDAIEREKHLKTGEQFFQPFLRGNAKMLRHDNGMESARSIISTVLQNHPSPLAIQVELVKERRFLLDTTAGVQLTGELQKTIQDLSSQLTTSEETLTGELASSDWPAAAGAYLDDDDEFERKELLKQLKFHQCQLKSLEDECYAKKDIGHQIWRFYKFWIRRDSHT